VEFIKQKKIVHGITIPIDKSNLPAKICVGSIRYKKTATLQQIIPLKQLRYGLSFLEVPQIIHIKIKV